MKIKPEIHIQTIRICSQETEMGYEIEKCVKFKMVSKSKVGDRSWGRLEGSLFNVYYTEM